jgi:tetratricopeptide (TPR) repeat protein
VNAIVVELGRCPISCCPLDIQARCGVAGTVCPTVRIPVNAAEMPLDSGTKLNWGWNYELRPTPAFCSPASSRSPPGRDPTSNGVHAGGRRDAAGQFGFCPIEETAEEDADTLFEEAQAAEKMHDLGKAEWLYRQVMKIDPHDATAAFNVGNLLRSNGRQLEAEAAFRTATETDPDFAETWF